MILLIAIIYMTIGAFIAGVLHEDEDGWVIGIVLLWPIVLTAILAVMMLNKPYKLGKKLLDKKKEKK